MDGEHVTINTKVLNDTETNSVCNVFYRIGIINKLHTENSIKTLCTLNILNSVISEAFFNQLRTVEQLGYIARSGTNIIHGPNSKGDTSVSNPLYTMSFLVQSPVLNADGIRQRIDDFITKFSAKLQQMTEKTFNIYIPLALSCKCIVWSIEE